MWIVDVACSDPECAEEREVIVADLDEVERVVCECGGCVVVIAVAGFEAVYAASA
jgi:hypothetical protein